MSKVLNLDRLSVRNAPCLQVVVLLKFIIETVNFELLPPYAPMLMCR